MLHLSFERSHVASRYSFCIMGVSSCSSDSPWPRSPPESSVSSFECKVHLSTRQTLRHRRSVAWRLNVFETQARSLSAEEERYPTMSCNISSGSCSSCWVSKLGTRGDELSAPYVQNVELGQMALPDVEAALSATISMTWSKAHIIYCAM